jgi:O-antigen ligase
MFTNLISRIIFVLIIFTTIVPIVDQQKLLFPYDSEKGLYFRFVAEILIGLWLILMLKEAEFRPKKTPINLSLGFLTFVLILVDIFGVDVYLSIFSNFERMAGLILYLTVFGYCLVISSVVNTPERWVILGVSMSIVAFIVSVKGIIQSGNSEEMLVNYGRVVSTVGNANQLASYLVLSLFIVIFLVSEWIIPLRKTHLKLFYTLLVFSGIFVIAYLLCLLKTSTRGGLIALFLSGLFMLFYLFFKTNQKRIKVFSGVIITGLFLAIFGLFILRKTEFIQKNSALNRITRLTDGNGSNTLQSRLETYKIAIEGIKAKPILGWGQETFHYTYAQYFNPKLYADAAWYDRVHNIILEWLIMGGILGLFAYLSLWAALLYQFWRKENGFTASRKIIILAFLLAYFIINLSLFDNLLSLMVFMTLIAFVNNHSVENYKTNHVQLSNKVVLLGSFTVVILFIFLIKSLVLKPIKPISPSQMLMLRVRLRR